MKSAAFITFLSIVTLVQAEDRWKTVDERFLITMPESWKRQKFQPIDSNCGAYKAKTADLEFDEWHEVHPPGKSPGGSRKLIDALKKKEANPKLLAPGEEVWRVDGRIASFTIGKADREQYGKRRFSNVARLHVPYPDKSTQGFIQSGYLSIFILYRSDKDLPTARRVLHSLQWKKEDSRVTGTKASR